MAGRDPAEPAANGIEVSGLVREFKGGVRAVDGIDLEVRPGEIYGFLGPNGAGKSTTVHVLTTLLPPTAGTARVAGHDVQREGAAVRDAIGAALQEAALDPNLTARDHVRLQGALHGMPKAERTRRGDELIEIPVTSHSLRQDPTLPRTWQMRAIKSRLRDAAEAASQTGPDIGMPDHGQRATGNASVVNVDAGLSRG